VQTENEMLDQTSQSNRKVIFVLTWLMVLVAAQYLVTFVHFFLHPNQSFAPTSHPFTWNPGYNFSDLTDYYGKTQHLTTARALYSGWPIYNYPPPAAFIYSALLNTPHPAAIFSALVIGSTVTLLILLVFGIQRIAESKRVATAAIACAVLTTVASYPLEYLLWRSNLEGMAFIVFSWGFAAFLTRRNLAAALLWGLGICIKPYPILLFLLLARRRKFREIAAGVGLFVTLQILCLYRLGSSLQRALPDMQPGFALYSKMYVHLFRYDEARFQHSILDSMKALCALFHVSDQLAHAGSSIEIALFHGYEAIAVLLFVGCAVWFWNKGYLNQIFAIILLILLLAPVGADYTSVLLHLIFAAWLLWLVVDVAPAHIAASLPKLLAFAVAFSILFAAQNWLRFYTGILHTAALLSLLLLAALVPMPSRIFAEYKESFPGTAQPISQVSS